MGKTTISECMTNQMQPDQLPATNVTIYNTNQLNVELNGQNYTIEIKDFGGQPAFDELNTGIIKSEFSNFADRTIVLLVVDLSNINSLPSATTRWLKDFDAIYRSKNRKMDKKAIHFVLNKSDLHNPKDPNHISEKEVTKLMNTKVYGQTFKTSCLTKEVETISLKAKDFSVILDIVFQNFVLRASQPKQSGYGCCFS